MLCDIVCSYLTRVFTVRYWWLQIFEQRSTCRSSMYFIIQSLHISPHITYHPIQHTTLHNIIPHHICYCSNHLSTPCTCTYTCTYTLFISPIQIDPGFTYAHTLCGHELANNEDLDKAVQAFRNSLLHDDRHYNAWWAVWTFMCTCVCMVILSCVCVYTCICIYICIYVCIYVCILKLPYARPIVILN